MKRFNFLIVLILCLALIIIPLNGCTADRGQINENPEVINVSYSLRPINLPSIVALQKNIFEKEFAQRGIEVKWHELAGPATTEGLASGSIDIATSLNYVSGIVSKANGNDIKFISGYSRFPEAIAIVAAEAKPINSIKDLKGKKVALQKGTMLHEMLIKALEENNLTIDDVELLGMASPDAMNALLQGHVDAAILPDPLLMKALSSKKVKIIRTAEGLISGQTVIAARTDFLEKYPEVVTEFLAIHRDILQWVEENEEEALALASETNQMDIKAVKALYPKFSFSMDLDEDTISELKTSLEFLKENGFIDSDTDSAQLINELIDTSYLP